MRRRAFLKGVFAAIPVVLGLVRLSRKDLVVRRGWLLKEKDL